MPLIRSVSRYDVSNFLVFSGLTTLRCAPLLSHCRLPGRISMDAALSCKAHCTMKKCRLRLLGDSPPLKVREPALRRGSLVGRIADQTITFFFS